ncbi:MAG: hypothetical protein LBH67_03390 [Rickettsia sp.]|nr:hypothetical protein [Rickettsia sp.]
MKNWNVKQGVSVLGVQLVREHANTPKFYGTNSSKQKSIPYYIPVTNLNFSILQE